MKNQPNSPLYFLRHGPGLPSPFSISKKESPGPGWAWVSGLLGSCLFWAKLQAFVHLYSQWQPHNNICTEVKSWWYECTLAMIGRWSWTYSESSIYIGLKYCIYHLTLKVTNENKKTSRRHKLGIVSPFNAFDFWIRFSKPSHLKSCWPRTIMQPRTRSCGKKSISIQQELIFSCFWQ